MSILWDEKKNTDLDSKDMLEVFSSVLADYQKENASASDVAFFVGLATGSDKELLHILLNLPSETCSKLLEYIRNYTSKPNENPAKPTLKKLLLTSPHKDLEIPLVVLQKPEGKLGMGYLIDTCLISELRRPIPSESVKNWFQTCEETQLLSVF